MRKVLALVALWCAFLSPAAALDFPQLDGRVIDEAHLLDDARLHSLENKLANLEARTSKQFMVVTLGSARGMSVDDYGLELRKHWRLEPNGRRVMLVVGPRDGRSVIQFDSSQKGVLPETVTDNILHNVMVPRFNLGDFSGGVVAATDSVIKVLSGEPPPELRAQRVAQNDVAVPASSEFPALSGRVVDDAGILDARVRESLRAKLAALEAQTSDQLVVATVRSLNGGSIEEYANRLFRRWQLGQKGKNNGVLLLVAPNDRKVRIEVGYGLEGTLTDAITKFIIQNAVVPRFKASDFGGGIVGAVNDIIKVLNGDEEFKQRATKPAPIWSWSRMTGSEQIIFMIFIPIVLFIIGTTVVGGLGLIREILYSLGFAKKRPRKGFWHGVDTWAYSGLHSSSYSSSSSWSSSSSGSGDSFSGGGGDSGGGGASGDW